MAVAIRFEPRGYLYIPSATSAANSVVDIGGKLSTTEFAALVAKVMY